QLAQDIHDRVCKVRGLGNGVPQIKPHSKVTIFVAESADDAEERDEVIRFLSDHFHVVPVPDEPLPSKWDQWQATVDAGLQASQFFVQVLGSLPGRTISGSDKKHVIAQYERAKLAEFNQDRDARKRILSWRKVGPELITDARMQEVVT